MIYDVCVNSGNINFTDFVMAKDEESAKNRVLNKFKSLTKNSENWDYIVTAKAVQKGIRI